jgi:hypothetical protein
MEERFCGEIGGKIKVLDKCWRLLPSRRPKGSSGQALAYSLLATADGKAALDWGKNQGVGQPHQRPLSVGTWRVDESFELRISNY